MNQLRNKINLVEKVFGGSHKGRPVHFRVVEALLEEIRAREAGG
jgi:hypothetical protein